MAPSQYTYLTLKEGGLVWQHRMPPDQCWRGRHRWCRWKHWFHRHWGEGTDVSDWGDWCRSRPPTGTIEATAHGATTATHICVNVVSLIDSVGMCIDVLLQWRP